MLRPIDIELEGEVRSILRHIVEKGAVFIRAEFIAVGMVGQDQAILFQLLTCLVEHLGCVLGLFEIPFVIVVRHPGTHDILRPKGFRIVDDFLNIMLQFLKTGSYAHHFEIVFL